MPVLHIELCNMEKGINLYCRIILIIAVFLFNGKLNGQTYTGDVVLFGQTSVDNFFANGFPYTEIDGNITLIGNVSDICGFANIERVTGTVFVENIPLKDTDDFSNLKYVGGFLVRNNTTIEEVSLINLEETGDDLFFRTNSNLTRINIPKLHTVGFRLWIDVNPLLEEVLFPSLSTIVDGFQIINNDAIENLDGFSILNTIGGSVIVSENALLSSCCAINIPGLNLFVNNNLPGCNTELEIAAEPSCPSPACPVDFVAVLALGDITLSQTNQTVSTSIISGTAPFSYQWEITSANTTGVSIDNATIQNPTFAASGLGKENVRLMVTDATGCVTSRRVKVISTDAQGCPNPQHPDKAAILELYDSLNGPNWPIASFQNWHDLKNEVICDPCLLEGVSCVNNRLSEIRITNEPSVNGSLPEQIGDLSELRVLQLVDVNISGNMPESIGSLSELNILDLSRNSLEGNLPASLYNLSSLDTLDLSNNSLGGPLSPTIGQLTSLVYFKMNFNPLGGTIPEELGNLDNLTYVDLEFTSLEGEIPSSLGNQPGLQTLILYANNLSGCLPESFLNRCDESFYYNNFYANAQLQYGGHMPDHCANGVTNNSSFGTLSDVTVDAGIVSDLGGGLPIGGVYSGIGVTDNGDGLTFTFDPSINGTGVVTVEYDSEPQAYCLEPAKSTINVLDAPAGCPEPFHPDRAAILALYDSLNGPNWPVAEFQNWHDLKNEVICDPCLLEGVTCTNDRVSNLVIRNEPQVTGQLPSEIGDLTALQLLTIDNTQINGIIPPELGDLPLLVTLNLTENSLTGEIPQSLGSLSSLTQLQLHGNELTGSLPGELGGLTSLVTLNLYNNNLTGAIPAELGNLTSLQILWAFNNQLSGQIPIELGNLTSIAQLLLYRNQLSGSIPAELGNLSSLQSLLLYGNQLNGEVPAELGNLISLQQLQLQQNDLEGCLPANLLNLCGKNVNLTSNPQLGTQQDFPNWCATGIIDVDNDGICANVDCDDNDPDNGSTIALATFTDIAVDAGIQTGLGGGTPIGGVYSGIGVTDDGNGQTFTFDPSIAGEGIISITYSNIGCGTSVSSDILVVPAGCPEPYHPDRAAILAIYDSLNGPNWPVSEFQNWHDLKNEVICDPCLLEGVTCSNDRVTKISITAQPLVSGVIPAAIGDLSELIDLFLYDNQIFGSIPEELSNLSSLRFLNLRSNSLSGTIPIALGSIGSLQYLQLQSNQLSGEIPPELGNLDQLLNLLLGENLLTGTIPEELGNLSSLTSLWLHANQLTGIIPTELGDLQQLRQLLLNDNQLSGSIPAEIGSLSNLTTLSLASNQLSGSIPPEFGNLTSIYNLRAQDNQLTGEIPEELGNLVDFSLISFNSNDLEGCLPTSLQGLCGKSFNISNNPKLGDQQNFSNWCSSGQVDFDNDGEGIFCDCDDNDPDNGSTIALSTFIDIAVDAGLQLGLGGGTPLGGVYSGIGVTDDGNGQTFTFDPSTAGEGIISITYSNIGCGTSASSDILVVPAGCPEPYHPDRAAILAIYDSLNGPNWPVAEFQNWHDLKNEVICDPCLLEGVDCSINRVRTIRLQNEPTVMGQLPAAVADLGALRNLTIEGTQLYGSLPTEIGTLTSLNFLLLGNNQLSGEIPPELGNLIALRWLNLSQNQYSGSIPPELGNISTLELLILSNNDLTGTIPPELGNLSSIIRFYLDNNQLIGTIPSELGNLSTVERLYLNNNQISGDIPIELGNLSALEFLYLYSNQLTGAIPAELANLAQLDRLFLYSNQLSGEVPAELGNLTSTRQILLFNNNLEGCLPLNLLNLCGSNTITFSSNPLLGTQQDFNNWCSLGGNVVSISPLADISVDAGVQLGLSGGSPTGGVYSGNGVTDNADGTSFSFDPAIAGEGETVITYTVTNASCVKSVADTITVLPIPCIAETAPVAQNEVFNICAETPSQVALVALPPDGASVNWYNVETGGTPLVSGSNVYVTSIPGIYYAESFDPETGCTSDGRTMIVYNFTIKPTLTILDFDCEIENGLYSVSIQTDADSLASTLGFVNDFGDGFYTINDIPIDIAINVRAINGPGCETFEIVEAECCDPVPPQFVSNEETCGDQPYPALTVTAGSEGTVDWYDAPIDGIRLAQATTAFVPPAPGIYYAEYVQFEDCISPSRTAVELIDVSEIVTFSDLADVIISAGIQTGLGGGSPQGGIYSGPGVTDDGNGQTFTFDPLSLPLGTSIITYTLSNACMNSATSTISVIDGECAFLTNDTIKVSILDGATEIDVCLTDASIATSEIASVALDGVDLLSNINSCAASEARYYASNIYSDMFTQGVEVYMSWSFMGQSYDQILVTSINDVVDQLNEIDPDANWKYETGLGKYAIASSVGLDEYYVMDLNSEIPFAEYGILSFSFGSSGHVAGLASEIILTGAKLALPSGIHDIVIGDINGCLDTVVVDVKSCADIDFAVACSSSSNQECAVVDVVPDGLTVIAAEIETPSLDCQNCISSTVIELIEQGRSFDAEIESVELIENGNVIFSSTSDSLISFIGNGSQAIAFDDAYLLEASKTYVLQVVLRQTSDITGDLNLFINALDFECKDTDGDGIIDALDNCPKEVNLDQLDNDGDGAGELCDCNDQDPNLITTEDCDTCPPSEVAQEDRVNALFTQIKNGKVIRP